MLNDSSLKVVHYEQKASTIFPNTDIKGGVAITYRDKSKNFGKIGTFISNNELKEIAYKVKKSMENSLSNIHHNRSSYRLTEKLYMDKPTLSDRGKSSERFMIGSNIFMKYPELFSDKVSNTKNEGNYVQIYGREANQRVYKYIKKQYISEHPNLKKWKVFLAKSNGTGEMGERLSPPEVAEPLTIPTQTFISFGSFDSNIEAESLAKYLKTKFTRVLLSVKKITPDNARKDVWEYVPEQDFTNNSDIDWSKSIPEIDQQLYKKYGLDESEIAFIEKNVRPME